MTYATAVPLSRLVFSDGLNYYGADTTLTVSATVNLPVASITHRPTGETLTDGDAIPAQDATDFHVPDTTAGGWATDTGSRIVGWSYDVTVTITAPRQAPILWSATVTPDRDGETLTPAMGELTGNQGSGSVRKDELVINVADYATPQAAVDAAPEGATVLFPPGVHALTETLTVNKPLHITGYGATLDARGLAAGATYGQAAAIRVNGTLGDGLPVTTAVAKWGRTISGVSSTAGISAGDLVLLANTESPVPGMTRTDRRKGELQIVDTVNSATQITVTSGVYLDYGTTGLALHRVEPVKDASVRGLTILMGGTGSWHNGVVAQYGQDITVEDVTVDGAEDVAVNLNTVWGGIVRGCSMSNSWSPVSNGGTGYGVAVVEGSRHCTVEGNRFHACRHFVAGGGKWPAAYVDVVGNSGEKSRAAAYDCHEPTFYWRFSRNTAVGVDSGFIIRGQYATVEDCEITDSSSFAYRAQTFDGVTEQRGVRLLRNSSTRSGYGLSVEGRAVGAEPDCIKYDVEVRGNRVESLSGGGGDGIFVSNFRGAAITDNTVTGTTARGIHALGLAATPSTGLQLANNRVNATTTEGTECRYVNGVAAANIVAESAGYVGARIAFCNDVNATGVTSVNPGRYGVWVEQCNRVTLANTTIREQNTAGYDALRVTGSTDVSINGGIISSARYAIYTSTTDYVMVTGVNVRGAANAARLLVDATNKVVANNIL